MKTKRKQPPALQRIVFEVKSSTVVQQIEASSVQELKTRLKLLWPEMTDYSLQAAAHLAYTDRFTVSQKIKSLRRIGVMSFQADLEDGIKSPPAQVHQSESSSRALPEEAVKAIRSQIPEPLL